MSTLPSVSSQGAMFSKTMKMKHCQKERLFEIATAQETTVSALIRQAIDEYLERYSEKASTGATFGVQSQAVRL